MTVKKTDCEAIVSVCVATCNQVSYIRRCLESVFAQVGDFDWELLVGDDCSDDGTSECVASMLDGMSNARHVRHASRMGASRNMQHLFSMARGKYIAHLDGDDYWFEEKLQRQIQFLDSHPGCVAVYSNALVIDEKGREVALFNDAGDTVIDLATLMSRGNFLNNSSMMLRAELVAPFVAIDHPFLDYEGHLLHARRGQLGHLGETLVAYRIAAQGSLVVNANEKVREAYFSSILSVEHSQISQAILVLAFADFMRRVAFRALSTRDVGLVKYWWGEVTKNFSGNRLHLLIAILRGFLGESLRLLWGVLRRKRRVLYRS